MIDNHEAHWKLINFWFVGFPMTIQLFTFWWWSNFVVSNFNKKTGNDEFDLATQHDICRYILLVTAAYLLFIELTALWKLKFHYFGSMPKIFNIVTPILILSNAFDMEESVKFWTIQIWAAVAIWFRYLLRLKTIWGFSFIIKMIVECARDMMPFMAVFFVSVLAFSSALGIIDEIA